MPLDPFFTSERKALIPSTVDLTLRWKAFQRLSHDLQAIEIDELLSQSKERPLTDEEFYVVQMWENKKGL